MNVFRQLSSRTDMRRKRLLVGLLSMFLLVIAGLTIWPLLSSGKQADTLQVYLSPQAQAKLENKRQQALAHGVVMLKQADDEVPGLIGLYGEEPYKMRARLKGDWLDHINTRKVSLRVNLQGGNALLGMRRFSIQRPETRGGHGEYLLLHHLRDEGMLAPRFNYVDYRLNENHIGVMAMEEHFSKELLESQGRRESVILAVDEEPYWQQRYINHDIKQVLIPDRTMDWTHLTAPNLLPLRVFRQNKVWKSKTLKRHYDQAIGLMRGFINGDIDADQVFDPMIAARFVALTNLWDVKHGLVFHNMRFYYNPITRLFEPIGFDNNVPMTAELPDPQQWRLPWLYFSPLVSSPVFVDTYNQTIARLFQQLENGELKRKILDWEDQALSKLWVEDASIKPYPFERLRTRLQWLKNTPLTLTNQSRYSGHSPPVTIDNPVLGYFAEVLWTERDGASEIEIRNVTNKPFAINSIEQQTEINGAFIPLTTLKGENFTIAAFGQSGDRQRIDVPHTPTNLGVNYRITATWNNSTETKIIFARRYAPPFKRAKYFTASLASLLKDFPFVKFNPEQGFIVPAGDWTVHKNLVFPSAYPVTIQAGATLKFDRNVRLVVRNVLNAVGTADQPINLLPTTDYWAGIVVLNQNMAKPEKQTLLRHVNISDIDYPANDDWGLTGAITLHNGNTRLRDVSIRNIATEDGLNIVNADFDVSRIEVLKSKSDAVDVDFGIGVINDSVFKDIGGDGIDISGTTLKSAGNKLTTVRDKAVSVGEASHFFGENFTIENSGTAIAAKDGSNAVLKDSVISDIRHTAYMSYIKKPEYNAAQLKVENTQLQNVADTAEAVLPSVISIDGSHVPQVSINIKKLYQNGYMAKVMDNVNAAN